MCLYALKIREISTAVRLLNMTGYGAVNYSIIFPHIPSLRFFMPPTVITHIIIMTKVNTWERKK